jgi:hypothetical protein
MTTLIEVEGNLVRTIERNVVKESTLEDMLAHLERRPPVSLPILPRNRTVGVFWDESEPPVKVFNIALAMAPSVRLIPIDPQYRIEGIEPRLAIPWTIFVFSMRATKDNPKGVDWAINNVQFYFSKDEPTGVGDNLIPALLPNVYRDANICWGNTGVKADQPLMDRIDETINTFYHTTFNHAGDLPQPWPYYKTTYKRWARETADLGNLCYRQWTDWTDDRRTHRTLQEALAMKVDVTIPLALPNAIPDLIVNPTFGRAEEWARGLNPTQRHRLRQAFENVLAEDPHAFDLPPAPAAATGTIRDDEDD